MTIRRPLSISLVHIGLTILVLAGAAYSTSVRADIDEVQPSTEFRYETSRWTEVDIALATNDGNPALLSIYSKGANGLRLLQNAFTDTQGRFFGELQLPAHLDSVVVVVRTADRQDTLDLIVGENLIAYAE
ncbi:hypothetical protein [Thiocapsa marina]|uniref:Uncharacterized protein n=1 Tax=Thiocapsa marina 5811 TaxID=768671 RepID=F9UDP1_9GAMM|nr:hypothetical protein [Thiocapsa marina]EGV17688.1 hypothetical protein ThimaDRAFT_3233 [Thiocapsa marina 5811]